MLDLQALLCLEYGKAAVFLSAASIRKNFEEVVVND
jgi:hypothetical protein